MKTSLKSVLHDKISANDGEIGIVHDVYFDGKEWAVRYLVVDTTGWWPGGRKVLLAVTAVTGVPDPVFNRITVNLTRTAIRNSPDIDTTQPVSREQEQQLAGYYGWPAYWMGSAGGLWLAPETRSEVAAEEGRAAAWEADRRASEKRAGNADLRSLKEVLGYTLQSPEGRDGTVDDFLMDDQRWDIAYLVAKTGNLLAPIRRLVPSAALEGIDYRHGEVHTRAHSPEIAESPQYDPGMPLGPKNEEVFQHHYQNYR